MPKTITLAKPYTVHGEKGAEEISEIVFRDPGSADYFACGAPNRNITQVTAEGSVQAIEVIWDMKAIKNWMTRLSGRTGGEIEGALQPYQVTEIYTWIAQELNPSGN